MRKAPQQPSPGRRGHPAQGKRKRCEVSPSPARGRGRMQKNETGLLSTIKKFIRGNAVKVGWRFYCEVAAKENAQNTRNRSIVFATTCKT